jgi:uncharacterized protein YktB (UPF0637 family)
MKKLILILLLFGTVETVSAMGHPQSVFVHQKELQTKIQLKQVKPSEFDAAKLLVNQDFEKNEVVSFLTQLSNIFMELIKFLG